MGYIVNLWASLFSIIVIYITFQNSNPVVSQNRVDLRERAGMYEEYVN